MTVRQVPSSSGFTLIEILAALVVLGLLVGGLAQGMQFGLQAWQRVARMAEAGDELDAVDRSLRRLIAQAHPGTATRPAPFVAGQGRLAFVSSLPDLPGMPARPAEAVLLVDDQRRLVLRWRPYLNAQRPRPAPFAEAELLRGVAGLEFGFWRADLGWVAGWDAPDLPALVRIRLELTPAGQRRWPDIVVAPGLDRP
jgi:general secretion pathway protein J